MFIANCHKVICEVQVPSFKDLCCPKKLNNIGIPIILEFTQSANFEGIVILSRPFNFSSSSFFFWGGGAVDLFPI